MDPGARLHNKIHWNSCILCKDVIKRENITQNSIYLLLIRVITKLPNSEQSYKGKVKTHNYTNRQNQSITGKLWKP
jgi:hypothetical protein